MSVQSIGKIAVEVESVMEQGIHYLITFMDLNQDYIITETLVCIKMILRKYPNEYKEILNKLTNIIHSCKRTKRKMCNIMDFR